jgi:4,5-DOPA dioxygenase extradiol
MDRKLFIKSLAIMPFVKNMKLQELNKLTESLPASTLMPVMFLGHGSPMNTIEQNEFTKGWSNAGKIVAKPNAILCISAHWETNGTFVTAMEKPKTIHDFGGFPKELFDVQYPANGSPKYAQETKNIITKTTVGLDEQWGLDHGCWSVLKHLYPNANVPVFQMSLDYNKPPQYHYELAKELEKKKKKGVLIIGSGNIVHNLRMIAWDKINEPNFGYDWAIEANEKMKQFILSNNHQSLIQYTSKGKAFDLAIPSPDHYLPLLYTLALKEENENISIFIYYIVMGSISMMCLKIGN